MGLIDTLSAYKSPLTLLLVLFGPTFLPRLVRLGFSLKHRYHNPSPASIHRPRAPISIPTILILSLNAFYAVLRLLFPAYDLFSYPSLPLFTSNLILRSKLLGPTAEISDSNRPLEQLLLGRLQNLDSRLDYMRFGHKPLLECVWCERTPDYLLYSLPLILAPYILAAMILGVLGLESIGGQQQTRKTEEWRWIFGLGLGTLAIGEVGVRYLWDLRPINGDVLHLSTTLHLIKNIVLGLYPIIYTFIPTTSYPNMAELVPPLVNIQNTLRLTNLTKQAIKRDPQTRRTWNLAAEDEARSITQVRADPTVVETIKNADLDISSIRQNAKKWVQEGWASFVKVEPA